jgi:hypothetical protein
LNDDRLCLLLEEHFDQKRRGASENEGDDGTQPPPPTVCNDPSAYTPYTTATHPTGSVAAMPWHAEDFSAYNASAMVECSNNKSTRSHLDVSVRAPGADPVKFEAAAEKAKAGCPVSKVLRAEISMNARLES